MNSTTKYRIRLFSIIILVFAAVFTFSGCAISYISNTYYKIVLLEEEKETKEEKNSQYEMEVLMPFADFRSIKTELAGHITLKFILPGQSLFSDVITPPPEI